MSRENFPYFPPEVQISEQIQLKELLPGCHKPDCIPSINRPQWLSGSQALDLYSKDNEILGLIYVEDNEVIATYAAPIHVLDWHEIVNFQIKKQAVAITYCPLCQTATAYNRQLGQDILDLGVSGLLYNSALVMFDRKTNALFSQVWSKGIVGQYADQLLTQLPLVQAPLNTWLETYPETKVLSTQHEHDMYRKRKMYDKYPYTDYYTSKDIRFPIFSAQDNLMHPKAIVYIVKDIDAQVWIIPREKLTDKQQQHTKNLFSIPHAGGSLFFLSQNKNDTHVGFTWNNWVSSEISFYFSARAYFPDAKII